MPSSPIPFLQRNLDTTLQLVIALSAAMTAEELVSFRVRLTEASIILGTVLATQEGVVPNADDPGHYSHEPTPPTATTTAATAQNTAAASSTSGNHALPHCASTNRNTVASPDNSTRQTTSRRPTTRGAVRRDATIRGMARSRSARNVTVIEMESDDDN